MRILLIKPYTRNSSVSPPIGLGYLASSLKGSHQIKILDGDLWALSPRKLERICRQENPDLIGIQSYLANLPLIKAYLNAIKVSSPRTVTLIGGPQPSGDPQACLEYFGKNLNYALLGEAEYSFNLLVSRLAEQPFDHHTHMENIPGLCSANNGESIINPPAPPVKVDEIPWPAWDLLQPERYPHAPHGAFYKQWPVTPIISSRGCPYNCGFCMSRVVAGDVIRYRPVDDVVAEIAYLARKRGIKEFHISDDCFTYSRTYVLEFCERLARLNLNLSWAFPNGIRIGSLDEELIRMMKRTGCYSISFGIESGSPRLLEKCQKGITVEGIRSQVALVKRFGLLCVGFFILGLPGSTPYDFRKTLNLVLELPLDFANFLFYHPLPGSPLYEEIIKNKVKGTCLPYPESFAHPGYIPEGMTPQELKNWQRQFFLSFYLRPQVIKSLPLGVHGLRHLKQLIFRTFHWIM